MSISRSELRKIFEQVFRAEGLLDAFIIDYFIDVYKEFSVGMSRTEKINRLFVQIEPQAIEAVLASEYPEMFKKSNAASADNRNFLSQTIRTTDQLHSIFHMIRTEDAEIEEVASLGLNSIDDVATLKAENRHLWGLLLKKMLENEKLRTIIDGYRKPNK